MSTQRSADEIPIITEEDLAALDTQGGPESEAQATDKVNAVFFKLGSAIVVILTIVMVLLMTAAVVMRYGFNSSIAVAAEGPAYLFPWLIAGGAIVAQAQMSHIGVTFFLEKLKGKAYDVLSVAIWVFSTILMAYVTYLALYMAGPMAEQRTLIMGWPQLGSFGAFIVMTGCMTIQSAARAWFFWKQGAIRQNEPETHLPTSAGLKNQETYGA